MGAGSRRFDIFVVRALAITYCSLSRNISLMISITNLADEPHTNEYTFFWYTESGSWRTEILAALSNPSPPNYPSMRSGIAHIPIDTRICSVSVKQDCNVDYNPTYKVSGGERCRY